MIYFGETATRNRPMDFDELCEEQPETDLGY